jgi:alpha-N-arabinofuranosidase
MVLTPTYHVFQMNRGHQDATSLRVDFRDAPPTRPVGDATLTTVSVSASRKDGRLLVSLSNLDASSAADVAIDLRGGTVEAVEAVILTAGALQDHNTPQSPSVVAPRPYDGVSLTGGKLRAHLPAHSFVTVSGAL